VINYRILLQQLLKTSKRNFETEKQLHIMKADVFYADIKQKTLEAKIDTNKLEVLAFDYHRIFLYHISHVEMCSTNGSCRFIIHSSGRSGKSYFFLYDENNEQLTYYFP